MINNIMQQSARIEDAYAGNLGGLKQRVEKAGVSNELLAAFVLQGQLAKKEAAQRNAAMQQPTNPSTVMEQMQQAADANSGPSEGDVVERTGIAGQQNAQIPQGPQGGGGIASQTGQVKLAGGGIVAFANGSEDEGAVEADALGQFLLASAADPEKAKQMREIMERIQKSKEEVRLLKRRDGQQGTTRNPRGRRPAPSAGGITGPSVTPPASGIATIRPDLETQIAEQYKEKGIPNPKDTTLEEQGKLVKERMAEFEATKEAAKAPITPPVAPAGLDPFVADTTLRDSAKTELDIDEEKKGLAAIERVRKLSDIEGSKQALTDMEERAEASYKDATPSRTDNLIDLLAAGGGKGGITSVGRRSGELRREENVRRRQLDQDVAGIKVTAIEIQSKFGTDAANAYQKAETDAIRTKQNARNYIATLDKNEREDVRAQMTYDLTSKKYADDVMSNQQRDVTLRLQIESGNIKALQDDVSRSMIANRKAYETAAQEVRIETRFSKLYDGSLDPVDDAEELKTLQGLQDTAVSARTIRITKEAEALRDRQLEINTKRAQFDSGVSPSLGADADAAIAKAGI